MINTYCLTKLQIAVCSVIIKCKRKVKDAPDCPPFNKMKTLSNPVPDATPNNYRTVPYSAGSDINGKYLPQHLSCCTQTLSMSLFQMCLKKGFK